MLWYEWLLPGEQLLEEKAKSVDVTRRGSRLASIARRSYRRSYENGPITVRPTPQAAGSDVARVLSRPVDLPSSSSRAEPKSRTLTSSFLYDQSRSSVSLGSS